MARPRKKAPTLYEVETVALADLKQHERNYRGHPEGQVDHLVASIQEHGFYRNVVVAVDGTILAGHGVAEAAAKLGMTEIPVIRVPHKPDSTAALKILTGDNELGRFAVVDDRRLTELLREIRDSGVLTGTGYSDEQLTSLLMVTRPASEILTEDAARHWAGMPAFGDSSAGFRVVISLDTEEDRDALMKTLGIDVTHKKTNGVWSVWWPPREREDLSSIRFNG